MELSRTSSTVPSITESAIIHFFAAESSCASRGIAAGCAAAAIGVIARRTHTAGTAARAGKPGWFPPGTTKLAQAAKARKEPARGLRSGQDLAKAFGYVILRDPAFQVSEKPGRGH